MCCYGPPWPEIYEEVSNAAPRPVPSKAVMPAAIQAYTIQGGAIHRYCHPRWRPRRLSHRGSQCIYPEASKAVSGQNTSKATPSTAIRSRLHQSHHNPPPPELLSRMRAHGGRDILRRRAHGGWAIRRKAHGGRAEEPMVDEPYAEEPMVDGRYAEEPMAEEPMVDGR